MRKFRYAFGHDASRSSVLGRSDAVIINMTTIAARKENYLKENYLERTLDVSSISMAVIYPSI